MLERVAELERMLRELLAGVELNAVGGCWRPPSDVALADLRVVGEDEIRRRLDVELTDHAGRQPERRRVEAGRFREVGFGPFPAAELRG